MIRIKRAGFFAAAAALPVSSVCLAAPEANDDMAARLAAAEARIAELEATDTDLWLTEQRADEIRTMVYDVLADADTRSSLMSNAITAGYDNGAVIGSADGNWMLRTNLLMQQRFIWNNQDDGAPSGDSDRWGFENTRTKFILSGHVVNPNWIYRVDINVGSPGSSTRAGTLNAYLGYNYGDGWEVRMGSMKTPLMREELVEAQHQLAVERSVVNYGFTGGYADGIQLSYNDDNWRMAAMYSDGIRTGQTAALTADTEFAVTGRFEYKAMGTWEQFDDFTSAQGNSEGLLLGIAGHYQNTEATGGAPATTELFIITGDASYEADGWNLFGSFVYADVDVDGAGSTNPYGFVVQGGFYLNPDWELFGRYEFADPDISGADDFSVFTVGATRYFAGHNSKWTTDVGFGIDSVFSPGIAGGAPLALAGYRSDGTDEDGQIVFRTQWQIYF